jgi:hypothetical protein
MSHAATSNSITSEATMSDINIEIRKERRDAGQVISAVAFAPSRRILGVVDVTVPLLSGYPISERVGPTGEQEIIALITDLARKVAAAVQTAPVSAVD